MSLKYEYVKLIGGPLTKGIVPAWNRKQPGHSKDEGFFSIHWEVQHKDRASLHLHVDAPKYDIDPLLSDLKQQAVDALLAANLEAVAERNGYGYKPGPRTSPEAVRRSKSTEALRIIVDKEQARTSTEQDIAAVHAAMWPEVLRAVEGLAERLDERFRPVRKFGAFSADANDMG